ncbi:hypothetical protein [Chryseobacterium sp. JV274]|uniref:hypothetical protein n=1 Tax=Chryseobacterium sp. JV274 TaxID=1932669 RepID=UPI0009857F26|nr:hypothetical protein [Chryseobacterium sp. JV274]
MYDLQKSSKIEYSTISTLGSILVLISATFPFINNIISVFYPDINTIWIKAANNNLAAVLWSLAICFQATILVFTKDMEPYLLCYAPVLFSSLYSSAFYFLPLISYTPNEDVWFFGALVGIVVVMLFTMYFTKLFMKAAKLRENRIKRSIEEIIKEN